MPDLSEVSLGADETVGAVSLRPPEFTTPQLPPHQSADEARRRIGVTVGALAVSGFGALSWWAAGSVSACLTPEALESRNLAGILAAKAVVILSGGGFCYALLALCERLVTPYVLLIQMAEIRARRPVAERGLTKRALDEVVDVVGRLTALVRGGSSSGGE